MKQGRPPIPRNLKLITGGLRPDRDNTEEPEAKVTVPPAPDYLQDDEIDVFVEMAGKLARMRVMTEYDVDALAMYAARFCVWKLANDNVRQVGLVVKSPKGYPIQNPYLSIANKAQQDCLRILTEFGMTPSSRTRVKAT